MTSRDADVHRADTRETYDRLAPVWAASTDDGFWNEWLERRTLRRLLPASVEGLAVLDAACAAGAHSRWLLDRGAAVTGIDLSPAMVAEATARSHDRGRFLMADLAEPLPLADRTFDGVLSSLTLDYLEDWSAPLASFARVLRPGGWLIVSDGHPAAPFKGQARPDYFATEMLSDSWTKGDVTVTSRFWRRPLEAVVGAFADAGFVLERLAESRLDDEARRRFPEEAAKVDGVPWFIAYRCRLARS